MQPIRRRRNGYQYPHPAALQLNLQRSAIKPGALCSFSIIQSVRLHGVQLDCCSARALSSIP